MKVLVVGSGGREHALIEALAASPLEPEMYAAPGNVGISRIAETVDIPVDDLVSLRDYAADNEIDLTVIGPETPLIGGISEAFWEAGLKVFGPSRAAARIEGSKVFAKDLMRHAGVPTARFEAFDREEAALAYLRAHHDYPTVVKADGAAAGKGVTVTTKIEASLPSRYSSVPPGRGSSSKSTSRGGRLRSSSSRMGRTSCLSYRPRTTSVPTTATRGRTPGVWGPTRPSCGWSRPRTRPYSKTS